MKKSDKVTPVLVNFLLVLLQLLNILASFKVHRSSIYFDCFVFEMKNRKKISAALNIYRRQEQSKNLLVFSKDTIAFFNTSFKLKYLIFTVCVGFRNKNKNCCKYT